MVAPCYFLACRIFEDAGLRCRAVGEGSEGIDLVGLERGLVESEREDGDLKVRNKSFVAFVWRFWVGETWSRSDRSRDLLPQMKSTVLSSGSRSNFNLYLLFPSSVFVI